MIFQIFDRVGLGKVMLSDATKALHHTLAMSVDEAERTFKQIDKQERGYITFGMY